MKKEDTELACLNAAVDSFANTMKAKLAAQHAKDWFGWDNPVNTDNYLDAIENSVHRLCATGPFHSNKKIDPSQAVDVANFAMFIWHHKCGDK